MKMSNCGTFVKATHAEVKSHLTTLKSCGFIPSRILGQKVIWSPSRDRIMAQQKSDGSWIINPSLLIKCGIKCGTS